MKFLVVVLLALLATPALGDQYSCQTVDRSAVAFVNTNVLVSKLETARRCSLSVDGATATGGRSEAFVGAFNNLQYELFERDGGDSGINADMLAAMFTGPFGPESNMRGGDELVMRTTEALDGDDIALFEECLREFAQMLGPQYEYGEIYDFGERASGEARCSVVMPSGGDGRPEPGRLISRDGALQLEFETNETAFSLLVPANFLIDMRDGNGIFN
jgi:hypothetical protein